ncbi:hypothetical protein WJX72_007017 [[Myrmecia] bisecta]|uniref:Kinesin motor domain-containing protein n=1 Tax=[Myrmecia] bisecta TaxID=41462 RepID=A0AAW1P574_9CHLO
MQLGQRTKDGATAESRIQELAALVKLLRRCLNQLMARTRTFIDNGIKFEKEAGQQVESVQLASESATKALEAELANAKRETAQAAAAHKSAAASWQGELDYHKGEASRIRRELERIESERDRAREEARRAEQARQELEGNVKGLKKETGQQLRELQMNRGEAMRALQDAREAAERREQLLQEDLQKMQVRAEYAESRIVVADSELSSLRKALQEQEGKLRETEAKLTTLRDEHNQLKLDFKAQLGVHAEVVAESSRILSDYEDLQERCSQMVTDLEDRQTQLAGTAQQLQAAQQGQQADHARWEGRYNSLQADRNLLAEREAGLQEEKAQLKAALGNALEQKAEVEEALHRALHEQHHLQHESVMRRLGCACLAPWRTEERLQCCSCKKLVKAAVVVGATTMMDVLKGTEARLISEAERLTSSLEASQRSLAAEQESKAAICQEAAIKAARLAHLEGEMEALQGVMGVGDQSEMVSQLVTRVAKLETAVAEAELTRRQLHNQLVEIRGNIRVFCRIRPAASSVVSCLPDGVSVRLEAEGVKDSSFTFDHVFDQQSSQADVFQQVSELVQSALDGYKVCLFSYGQTGAGKTHTMQGTRAAAGQGIIPRAVGKILECVAKLQEQGWQYELQASFIEVYNETLRDLLADTKGRDAGRITDQNAIKHGAAGGHTIVVGAVREPVESAEGAAGLVKRAAAARAVEATAMNAVSSRSHSVFMLYITGKHEATGACVHGALNLVDLAGSERLNRSEASGQRQKEACSINKSLSSLGDVFQALSAKTPHVPYRNSKLTHLLQPCLGGDGKTLMFVNINPEAASANETLCSLRFAAKVNACETGARGGAKRHTSQAAELPSSSSAGASAGSTAQANRRQSLSGAPLGPGIKRKAPLPPAPMPQRSLKPRIG